MTRPGFEPRSPLAITLFIWLGCNFQSSFFFNLVTLFGWNLHFYCMSLLNDQNFRYNEDIYEMLIRIHHCNKDRRLSFTMNHCYHCRLSCQVHRWKSLYDDVIPAGIPTNRIRAFQHRLKKSVDYHIYQPLHSGRIWHKVNFNRFEFRVFLLLD